MVEKKKDKKKKSALIWFIFGLSIGCLISCALLANYLSEYAKNSTIPVVKVDITDDNDKLSNNKNNQNGENDKDNKDDPETTLKKYYNLKPGFKVVDAEQTWVSANEVSIFKMTYDNETGDTTVSGTGNNKLIAPGTTNTYYFELINTGNTGLDYQVKMDASLSDNITSIPVEVKLSDHNGRYVLGSETLWQNVSVMDDIVDEGKLSKGNKARYVFSWQWPYEWGNDEYDTYLGDLAVQEDVTLTVNITVVATGNGSASGGIVATGDNSQVVLYAGIAGVSAVLMIFLLMKTKKGEDDEE